VITNGDWLILFLNTRDAFLEEGSSNPNHILEFTGRSDIETRFTDVFRYLEYQQVLGETPPLTPGELSFHVQGVNEVDRAMYGLRLRYIEHPGIYRPAPVIKVTPVVFLRTRYGAWLRIEQPPQDYELRDYDGLSKHLTEVKQTAQKLRTEINNRLGTSLEACALAKHYDDDDCFSALPGVQVLMVK